MDVYFYRYVIFILPVRLFYSFYYFNEGLHLVRISQQLSRLLYAGVPERLLAVFPLCSAC